MIASKRLLERLEKMKEQAEAAEARQDLASQVANANYIMAIEEPGMQHLSYVDVANTTLVMNANSSPIEFLVTNGDMEFGQDEEGMAGVRFHAAIRFRDLVAGAQVKGLKSANLEAVSSGGFGPADILSFQMDCRKILARIRKAVGEEWIYSTLEAVVVYDEWLDLWPEPMKVDRRGVKRRQRLKTIAALHYGLDVVGETQGYMNWSVFKNRWPDGAPSIPPSVRRRIQATMVAGPLVPRS